MTYRILALPGGGVRGALTAALLERLENAAPGFLAGVDMFAGTSTGGLLALGLAAGRTPAEMRGMYDQHGSEIFKASGWRRVVGRLYAAPYSSEPLRRSVVELLGNVRLGELPRRVLASSFDLKSADGSWRAKFFHNFPEPGSDDVNLLAVDVAMATSAAPTYFPSYAGYVDGGVVANDPTMTAIAQALDCRHSETQKLEDLVVLTVGTGDVARSLEGEVLNWGLVRWSGPLVDILFSGAMDVVAFEASRLLGERYCRLQPTLEEDVPVDGYSRVGKLEQLAARVDLAQAVTWLQQKWCPGDKEVNKNG